MASSRANALEVVLIERVPSVAARASAPTWSTPGSPCRNRRNVASEAVTSANTDLEGATAVIGSVEGRAAERGRIADMADFDPAVPVERFKPTGGMLVG